MAVQYQDLIDKNGTIYNTKTGQGYPSPDALAKELGVPASSIQWSSIKKDSNYQPGTKFGGSSTTTATQPVQTAPAGVDPNLWNSLSAADKAFVIAMNTNAQSTYQQGVANYSINAQTMQQALQVAQKDPTIKAIYGDNAKMALSDLHNNLGQLNAEYASQFGLMTAEQAKARKDLAEREAAAGRAYSGFREQAEGLQNQQQTAVIGSTTRQLQQNLRQLGSQYESQFGSKALASAGPIAAGGQSYAPYGGITGSQPIAQKQAIEQKQSDVYNTISNPLTR